MKRFFQRAKYREAIKTDPAWLLLKQCLHDYLPNVNGTDTEDEQIQGYGNMLENHKEIRQNNEAQKAKGRNLRFALNRFGAQPPYDWVHQYLNGIQYRSVSEIQAMLPATGYSVQNALNSTFGHLSQQTSGYHRYAYQF